MAARVLVAAQTLPGAYPTLQPGAGTRDVQFQAWDASGGNYTPLIEGKTVVLVKNAHATDPKTCTFVSVVDDKNRTGDITAYSLAAGDVAIFGPFKASGWSHTQQVWFDGSSTDIQFAVLTLP